jgi:Asp/Glu/hydantoin racemase
MKILIDADLLCEQGVISAETAALLKSHRTKRRGLCYRSSYHLRRIVAGQIEEASRAVYRAVIARLVEAGAEAIILGCTEIMLLVGPEDSSVPIFDTTALHAEAAIEYTLKD